MSYKKVDKNRILDMLLRAHSSRYRKPLIDLENLFYKKEIKNKKVLVIGSGLGIESKLLSEENISIIGIDIFDILIDFAKKNNSCENILYKNEDIFSYFPSEKYDVAVLNMCTLGNFKRWGDLIHHVLENVSNTFYFSFYNDDEEAILDRINLYKKEINKGEEIIRKEKCLAHGDDGIWSCSLSKKDIKELGYNIEFYNLDELFTVTKIENN